MKLTKEFETIREWAKERGIYDSGDPKTQFLKLIEESGELGKAILKNNKEETIDAIGDIVIVLTNLTVLCKMQKQDQINNIEIEDCINSAYEQIKQRTGKMENGTFVKD